jgi:hypothetical protein
VASFKSVKMAAVPVNLNVLASAGLPDNALPAAVAAYVGSEVLPKRSIGQYHFNDLLKRNLF